MRRRALALGVLLSFGGAGCSGDASNGDGSDAGSGAQGTGGGAGDVGAGATGGTTAGTGGATGSGGAAAGTGGTASGSGATGGSESGGTAGAADGGDTGSPRVGICGIRGEGTVDGGSFEGFEEHYMVGEEEVDEGILDVYICAVRFQVTRVGETPTNCGEFAGQQDECLWTHFVEFGEPEVVTDEDGVCANSSLGLDSAAIDAIDGSRAAYGFVSEYAGHNSVVMKYEESSDTWDVHGNATWDEGSGEFRFDRREGACSY